MVEDESKREQVFHLPTQASTVLLIRTVAVFGCAYETLAEIKDTMFGYPIIYLQGLVAIYYETVHTSTNLNSSKQIIGAYKKTMVSVYMYDL